MVGNKLVECRENLVPDGGSSPRENLVPDGGRKKCSPVTHECWSGPESMICSPHSLPPKMLSVVATWKAGFRPYN